MKKLLILMLLSLSLPAFAGSGADCSKGSKSSLFANTAAKQTSSTSPGAQGRE